tara:strand:+ start:348 stop:2234 length:1887 start_codon:yes stop_codon:yes gene_type:complete
MAHNTVGDFNIERFKTVTSISNQYDRQLARLKEQNKQVDCIESAVSGAMANLKNGKSNQSFVIYGEPQSGKTEMMICLTAKLLDSGTKFIIHLMNDSVDLLNQNLIRFQTSGLAPTAKSYKDILDPSIDVRKGKYVIFSKKNGGDLQKLINKIGSLKGVTVIDDEADYASPNSKINYDEKTKINALIEKIIGSDGDYIGVTATPARLDLNNTFSNDSGSWVDFPTHDHYTGQDEFFPIDTPKKSSDLPFILTMLPDQGDDPKYARTALFSFLVNVAHLNRMGVGPEEHYSMLVHTSGKKVDHKSDWGIIDATMAVLVSREGRNFDRFVREIWDIARVRYPDADPNQVTDYVVLNSERHRIVVLNSDKDFTTSGSSATSPAALFTIIIGGNIVSRGVTFENLLSMFFTRDVKHKIQQDTYIQRARMFGARGGYLSSFELTIPSKLYGDWHRCFVFHKLALDAIRNGNGSLVWLSDTRIAVAASASIDRATVDLNKGEMSFCLFGFDESLDQTADDTSLSMEQRILRLKSQLSAEAFPDYLLRYIKRTSTDVSSVAVLHPSSSIENYTDVENGTDKSLIVRKKGFFGRPQMQSGKYPNAIHHLKIFRNSEGKARLFYKREGSIQFIQNIK